MAIVLKADAEAGAVEVKAEAAADARAADAEADTAADGAAAEAADKSEETNIGISPPCLNPRRRKAGFRVRLRAGFA
jgi:hypothetical protein